MSRALTLLVWLVLGSAAALAQADTVRVRLVTFYPGSEIYSVYGHTELRVTQGQADYYFNYGVFDFNTPGFVYRFVTGEADYMCVAVPPQYAMMEPGRRMVEQELNLTQEQGRQVRDYLVENSMPGQNTYRYQYLSDNCSTRPRDIIEQAIGQPLHNPAITTNITYRDMMKQCASNYAWLQFGIDLVLGADLDRVISEHEQMFIPMVLMKAAEGTTLERNGQLVPLVNATEVIVDGSEDGIVMPHPMVAQPHDGGTAAVGCRRHHQCARPASATHHTLVRHCSLCPLWHGWMRAVLPHLCECARGHLAQLQCILGAPLLPDTGRAALDQTGQPLPALVPCGQCRCGCAPADCPSMDSASGQRRVLSPPGSYLDAIADQRGNPVPLIFLMWCVESPCG